MESFFPLDLRAAEYLEKSDFMGEDLAKDYLGVFMIFDFAVLGLCYNGKSVKEGDLWKEKKGRQRPFKKIY